MIKYYFKAFNDLSLDELYQLLALRQDVFIVEQDCPFLDADGIDNQCHHILGMDESKVVQSYARLVPTGITYPDYNSIGRVITAKKIRGMGEGRRLMVECINQIAKLYPYGKTKIAAQVYALPFYESLGFEETGDRYEEDGIPHASMVLK